MNSTPRFAFCVLVIFLLLFGFVAVSSAQEIADKEEARKWMYEQQRMRRESKTDQEVDKQIAKAHAKFFWNGKDNDMFLSLAGDGETRQGLEITDEQYAVLSQPRYANRPWDPIWVEFNKKGEEFDKFQTPGTTVVEFASEEKRREYAKLMADWNDYMWKKDAEVIENVMTPEQKRKFQEAQIAMMSDYPMVTPNMFEALDLSDDQRNELAKIQKELEPDFEKYTDKMHDILKKIKDKTDEYHEKRNIDVDRTIAKVEELQKKILTENPDLKKEYNEMLDESTAFTKRLKFQMFDVLTDEQMDRMSELINNPPDYIKKFRDRRRKHNENMRGASIAGFNLNSWKPGDPIPEEYLQKRRPGRFPKKK